VEEGIALGHENFLTFVMRVRALKARQRRKQIRRGNDRKKGNGKSNSTDKKKQIPGGNDRKKSNGKSLAEAATPSATAGLVAGRSAALRSAQDDSAEARR
jgi:hypothetical protein